MASNIPAMTDSALIPAQNEWQMMRDMAASLVPTGFLPESIKSPEQAVAIMLKGRELRVPPMYALSNIVIVKGRPTASAELMLALIHRDHGQRAIRVKESDDAHCTVEYRMHGWNDVQSYTFTIKQAEKAGLMSNPTWQKYPSAMLRARCISAVARMAFPGSISGMYVPGELGESTDVNTDGEVVSTTEVETIQGARPYEVNVETGEIYGEPDKWGPGSGGGEAKAIPETTAFGEGPNELREAMARHDITENDLSILARIKGFNDYTSFPAETIRALCAQAHRSHTPAIQDWFAKQFAAHPELVDAARAELEQEPVAAGVAR